jgi:hypothetical protein
MKSFALFAVVLALGPSVLSRPVAQGHSVQVSLIEIGHLGTATSHGWDKVKAALTSKGVSYEVVARWQAILMISNPSTCSRRSTDTTTMSLNAIGDSSNCSDAFPIIPIPMDELNHELVMRFGAAAGPLVEQGLQRASQILPEITAYCLPEDHFPTTRGWPGRQRQGNLPAYVKATPSDTEQFENIQDAADDILLGRSSPKQTPMQMSRWFTQAATDVRGLVAKAEAAAGANTGKEFTSTMVDLKILSDLDDYHAHRSPAGLSYALFERTHDVTRSTKPSSMRRKQRRRGLASCAMLATCTTTTS